MSAALHLRRTNKSPRIPAVFTAGFRFYFLGAGLFSVFAMLAWFVWLAVHAAGGAFVELPMSMAPHLWHAHEMMFGYTVAVMAGFFVTAVPNWIGTDEPKVKFIAFSGAIWFLGRLAVWFSAVFDPVLVAVIDLAFIPILSSAILGRLAQKSQMRNFVFLFLLAALFTGNLMMHLDWIEWTPGNAEAGVRLAIFASAAMIIIVGGRVVPAFTRNALNRQGGEEALPQSHAVLDKAGILFAMLTTLASLPFVPFQILAGLCIATGAVNLLRLAGWKGWRILKNPILWILHIAYLLTAGGYLVYGLSLLTDVLSETAALHLLAAGGIGSMTLAMMTRASLGHSGRPLIVSGPVVLAYVLLIAAALVRTFALSVLGYFETVLLSGILWILAFSLYVGVYFPILTSPRMRK